jgi:hypothetical protein
MKYLFIGGPRDGERAETAGQRHYRTLVIKPFKIEFKIDPFEISPYETHTYTKLYLGREETHAVYVSSLIKDSTQTIVDHLIKNYNPKCTTSP